MQPSEAPARNHARTPDMTRVPESFRRNRSEAANDDHRQTPSVAWVDADNPIEAFMHRHGENIDPGWRRLAVRTLTKFLAVIDGHAERRRAVAGLMVCSTGIELCFAAPSADDRPDDVVQGILRKTRDRSCTICKDCGRPGRMRLVGERQWMTQCTKCVAPQILYHAIWELAESLRFLRAVGRPIGPTQIPKLLRPSFMRYLAESQVDHQGQPKHGQMALQDFVKWAEGWQDIGAALDVVH